MNQTEILERVWRLLERGAQDRNDDFHTPALATVNAAGEAEVRTVVLRRVSQADKFLLCHIDARSPKAHEIALNGRVSWLFYHRAEKLQVRIRGAATLHINDELTDAQWAASTLFSRRVYCGKAPGTIAAEPASGLPDFLTDRKPSEEESNILGRRNFAVLRSTIEEIDAYELNVRGHRRSLFVFTEAGEIQMSWLTP